MSINKDLPTVSKKRLYSLDALRGFDMFWIIGGGFIIELIAEIPGFEFMEGQKTHVAWEGLHFEDLIFPLFMFMAGVAIPMSLTSKLQQGIPKSKLFWKVFKRMIILIFLGVLYNGGFKDGFENARIASVLGQIGIAYFFASLIVLYCRSLKSRIIWLLGILVGIAIVHLFIPVPGYGAGVLTPEGFINGFIDRLILPGLLFNNGYDPEGILCCISATGVTLMGTLAGNILLKEETTGWQKISYLGIAGIGSIILALSISPFYPIIKQAWTSTFNLMTGGLSFLLMALFYMIIDHLGYKKWAFFFRVIGMNSIFIYLFVRIVGTWKITEFFFGSYFMLFDHWGENIIGPTLNIGVMWLLLYYMYVKKIFLRV